MDPPSLNETDNHDTPQMDTSTYLNSPIQTTPDLLPDLGTLHHEPMPDTSPLETLTRQQKRNLQNRQRTCPPDLPAGIYKPQPLSFSPGCSSAYISAWLKFSILTPDEALFVWLR